MTVTTTTNTASYTGDGSTTAFAFSNLFFANGDLVVSVDNVVKTIVTDYNVTGAGVTSGGTVTFVTAPANSTEVVIRRTVTYDQ